jgi:hypothetical protein
MVASSFSSFGEHHLTPFDAESEEHIAIAPIPAGWLA